MRRMLRVLGWMNCGVSALLFLATVFLWVRGLGHSETWGFNRFEPNPDWNTGPLAGQGTSRLWYLQTIDGRLWLGSAIGSPGPRRKSGAEHRREVVSADQAYQYIEAHFQTGERPWFDGVASSRRFLGVKLYHGIGGVAVETGRPWVELFDVIIPLWLPALLFALWPTLFLLRRLLRRKRYAKGLCPTCGYDLRATPYRCPECGREVVARAN